MQEMHITLKYGCILLVVAREVVRLIKLATKGNTYLNPHIFDQKYIKTNSNVHDDDRWSSSVYLAVSAKYRNLLEWNSLFKLTFNARFIRIFFSISARDLSCTCLSVYYPCVSKPSHECYPLKNISFQLFSASITFGSSFRSMVIIQIEEYCVLLWFG